MFFRLIILTLSFLPAHFASAQPPITLPDFSANYSVKLNGIQAGELKRRLITDNEGQRIFISETQAKGVFAFFKPEKITETSKWRLNEQTIQPQHYSYLRRGGKKDKTVLLDFDWSAQRLHINDKQYPWSLDLAPRTLDKLVYQLALMADLARDKHKLSYKIADGGRLKTYNIIQLGQETITTPLGKITNIKLTRIRVMSNELSTFLLCAPELIYLPVQLEHTEKDGTVFTATLRRLTGIDTKGVFESPPQ